MSGRTREGDALTELVLPAFRLNAEFLAAAAMITAPHHLTPAQWQVLGTALHEPLSVSEIARRVGSGLTRQSVQRVANDVVGRGWATWQRNPSHRTAKLLTPTSQGEDAVAAMSHEQNAWANAVGEELGLQDLRTLSALIPRVVAASRRYRED